MTGAPEVAFQGVRAGYRSGLGWVEALRGFDLNLPAARITALVGPNGAGKTTVFRLIMGFVEPTAGSVYVDGAPPSAYRAGRGIGYVPERRVLPPHWTPAELFRRGVAMTLPPILWDSAIRKALEMTELPPEMLHRAGRTLSRGMAQRVTLSWALLGGPQLVLLDEPLSGLDAAARRSLRAAIARVRDAGATVVLASHDLREVEVLSDGVVVLSRGTVARRLSSRRDISEPGLEAVVLEQGSAE